MSHPSDAESNSPTDFSRRDFVVATMAVGAAAGSGMAHAAAAPVNEKTVSITTPDGVCDASFITPSGTGKHPAVLIWTDAFGLRPSMRDIGKRLAAEGYAVLIPNPFYRVAKTPVFETASTFSFKNPADMAKLPPLMGSIGAPGAAERDAGAFVAFLDAQPEVDATKKIGTQGYCMGGALVMRTAAAFPARIGAGASFHGGNLVNDTPLSPHLLAPKIKATMYLGVAANDDEKQPDAKVKLKEAFAAAKVPATVEVYPAKHGWCVPDMPVDASTGPIYNMPEAERAWGHLLGLYKSALA